MHDMMDVSQKGIEVPEATVATEIGYAKIGTHHPQMTTTTINNTEAR